MSASPPLSDASSLRQTRKRRNSTAALAGDERQAPKQRTKRTALACERCRMKKLRCMGGHPCGACQRASADCDFGDRVWDSQQSISATNQRLSQLEKTIADLAASLSHLKNPQPVGDSCAHASVPPLSGPSLGVQAIPDSSVNVNEPLHLVSSPKQVSPAAQSQGSDATPNSLRSSSANPRMSETLESRWAALQRNVAPFPPLMAHPTVWSEEPAKPSLGGIAAQPTLGLVHYRAQVHLQSEPISEGIIGEMVARALFGL